MPSVGNESQEKFVQRLASGAELNAVVKLNNITVYCSLCFVLVWLMFGFGITTTYLTNVFLKAMFNFFVV